MKKLVLCAFVCSVMYSSLHAQTSPRVISYQGMLQTLNGTPVRDSTYPVTIVMWTDSAGGTPLWQDVFQTEVRNGIFNILLGSQTPLPAPSAMDHPLWISVSVSEVSEAYQRSRLAAVPMALNVADSSITAAKMGTDYISSVSVNGQKVTGTGTALNIASGKGVDVLFDPTSNSLYLSGTGTDTGSGKGGKPLWVGDLTGNNYAPTPFNTVAGGEYDTAWPYLSLGYASVLGGQYNEARGEYASIGGGYKNWAGSNATVAGGDSNFANGNHSTVGGGSGNSVGTTGGTIAGGDTNLIQGPGTYQMQSFIGGGEHNSIVIASSGEQQQSVIVGGLNNTVSEGPSFIGGGEANVVTQEWASVVGGLGNIDSNDLSFIGGGARNKITPADGAGLPFLIVPGVASDTFGYMASAIVAGFQNLSTNGFDFIGGGWKNSTIGLLSAIPGGYGLKLGDLSFGFNGVDPRSDTAITDLYNSNFSQVAYFGNVNLMIGNVDGTARQLQFYAPNMDHNYGSSAFYSSFQADTQSTNINYTLPGALPVPGQFLKVESRTGTNVQLTWDTVTGSGGGGAGLAWLLHGNLSVPPGLNYLGTNDSEAFEIHVDNFATSTGGNQRVMRYEEGTTSPNILGGSSYNTLGTGLSGSAVLSGGSKVNPNRDSAVFSVVAGGEGNAIDALSEYSSIGGGRYNLIQSSYESIIGGGYGNLMISSNGVIGSGFNNTIQNGISNGILAGDSNSITGIDIGSDESVVMGGYGNRILNASYATLGGGNENRTQSDYTVVNGGESNTIGILSDHAAIGGGEQNKVLSDHATIGGGLQNVIGNSSYDDGPTQHGVIAGGCFNTIDSSYSGTIGGGCGNTAMNYGTAITGGVRNTAKGFESYIGGGIGNYIEYSATHGNGDWATIAGGDNNQIKNTTAPTLPVLGPGYSGPQYGAITGGANNAIYGKFDAIGGGSSSATLGAYGTIPGGHDLIALDNQTVVGFYNFSDTGGALIRELASRTGSGLLPLGTDPLFIVGNGAGDSNWYHDTSHYGTITRRSNAFTVAYAGYSTAYYNIGSGGADSSTHTHDATIMGSTYSRNTIIAWGNAIPGAPGDLDSADIGVKSIHWNVGTNQYDIMLNVHDPDGSLHTFKQGQSSIVASINQGLSGTPGIINVTSVEPGTSGVFHVTTWPAGSTTPTNTFSFMFQVVAR